MKRILFLAAFLVCSVSTFAQQVKFNFSLARKLQDEALQLKEISVLVKGNIPDIMARTEELHGTFKYSEGDIAAIRLQVGKIHQLAALPSVQRIEDNDLKLQPMNEQAVINSHSLEVHNGWNLPQPYDGSGVVVGIIDEGIDYTHPDFRNINGTTRLKYLWDQTIPGTTANPLPYGYGKEFIGDQIDTSQEHFDAPTGHGTHVAGTACGNGKALNNYSGIAPGADIIVVKINLNTSDDNFLSTLEDAIEYIFTKADSLGEPAVINISLGTYFGTHDARDIHAQMISNLITAQNGRAVVCAAGNQGNASIHLGYQVTSDTSMTWLQSGGGQIYFQVSGDSGDFENINFSIGVDRIHDGFTRMNGIPFNNVLNNLGVLLYDTIYNASGERLGRMLSYRDYSYGTYTIEYLITPDSIYSASATDTTSYLWRVQTTGSGRLDAWSYDMVFDNLPDSASFPPVHFYKKPDTDQTIVSSFTCSNEVITVGAFTNRNYYTNCNFAPTYAPILQPGAIWNQSSKGPTRDNRIKPDITAAGDWVLSCGVQSGLTLFCALAPDKVAAGGKHFRSSGTSMSSPVVCGIGALYFQKNPGASWQDFKNALLTCAIQDSTMLYPNTTWGYGKANAYLALKGCSTGLDDMQADALLVSYPNPMNESCHFKYNIAAFSKSGDAALILYNSLGQEIKRMAITEPAGEILFRKNDLAGGVYFYSLKNGSTTLVNGKLVIL